MDTNDKEIINASEAIDEALSRMTKENRGKTSRNILKELRDLNDHIALKIWREIEPLQPMSINKVASKFFEKRDFKYIGIFDKFLRKSLSHFTPNEDGAERLLIKYYKYLLMHKSLMWNKYKINIIENIDKFLDDTDEQTKEYYKSVANRIEELKDVKIDKGGYDNYYINKVKEFYVNREVYYEVTLEPAEEKPNKFNRVTAFTKFDINTNYAVALKFIERRISAFDVDLPIKIIVGWRVSIRPCEFNNFAKILNIDLKIQRNHSEYRTLMSILTHEGVSLIDIIDSSREEYLEYKNQVISSTKEKKSKLFNLFDRCRQMSIRRELGINTIRYLLVTMNNRKIKDQYPFHNGKVLYMLNMSSKCFPFEQMPFSFNPKGHHSNIYEVVNALDFQGREDELLARKVRNNTEQLGILYSAISDLDYDGSLEDIKKLVDKYDARLYDGFKPDSKLELFKDHVYQVKYDKDLKFILDKLYELSSDETNCYSECFREDGVIELKRLEDKRDRLDDPVKEKILVDMFKLSRVRFVYGAAGTGKSTLINHIAKLMFGKNRAFLSKTNPAVENLRRKVICQNSNDYFATIDSFTSNKSYNLVDYDLIVVDECSTVQNEEIAQIINMLGDGVLVLVGDIYQIPSIGFGNWFTFAKEMMPDYCVSELEIPYRGKDDNELKEFWDDIRNIKKESVVLEEVVRNEYSHKIDKSIFDRKAKDEIILCLNYNGLYGLNNINRLLQLGNPNPAVEIGVWQFKVGDPVLFNDSERFEPLYNNLKGEILDIKDNKSNVTFIVEVNVALSERDIRFCPGLELLSVEEEKSVVKFNVDRRAPYSSDEDDLGNAHILPFQVAYAVSIHKSQGLEYESVKIVIADDSEDRITHNIFYTAITRTTKHLTIYWSPEVCNRVLGQLKQESSNKDYFLFKLKHQL